MYYMHIIYLYLHTFTFIIIYKCQDTTTLGDMFIMSKFDLGNVRQ